MKEIIDNIMTYLLIREKYLADKDIYQYGLEVFLLNFINVVSILFLGWITNTLLDASIFLVTFIIIRQLTGGFHFRSYAKCIISFIGVYLVFLILNHFLYWNPLVCLSILLTNCLIIILNSPIENANKPLNSLVVNTLKYKISGVTLIFLLLYTLSSKIMNGMVYAIGLDVFLILVEKIRRDGCNEGEIV